MKNRFYENFLSGKKKLTANSKISPESLNRLMQKTYLFCTRQLGYLLYSCTSEYHTSSSLCHLTRKTEGTGILTAQIIFPGITVKILSCLNCVKRQLSIEEKDVLFFKRIKRISLSYLSFSFQWRQQTIFHRWANKAKWSLRVSHSHCGFALAKHH